MTSSDNNMPGEVERLRDTLEDLVSWFPESGPTQYGPWIIRAGSQGADDAVDAARALLAALNQQESRNAE